MRDSTVHQSENILEGRASKKLEPEHKETKVLNYLLSGKTKNLFKYRFFREPYWLGYISLLTIVIHIATAIGVYHSPFSAFTLPIAGILFAAQVLGITLFIKRYIDKQEDLIKENPEHMYETKENISFLAPNFTKEQERTRTKNNYYDILVYLYHFGFFAVALSCMYAAYITESYFVAISLALLWGFVTSLVAESWSHEFIHRRSLHQQMLGASLWATFCYGSFLPEHTMGHHVHVSTPEDPSSAPKGMTLYQFLPNAILNNPINGFKLEAKRLRDRGISPWHPRNRLIWLSAFSALWGLSSYAVGGSYGLVFWLVATLGSILSIEVANYVMHYGLERQKLANGRYERVSPLHSWNREGPLHLLVINLTRHSDHHAFPRRPYQILRYFPEAPQLPIGYERLIFMAWLPKYFFKTMDPQVDKHMNKLKEWKENNIDDYKRVMNIESSLEA